jgi:DNA (cytosine-5)-methyltransferase 1
VNAWAAGWDDGLPRVAYGVRSRVARLRGLGNAVVPQVAEHLGRQLLAAHHGEGRA